MVRHNYFVKRWIITALSTASSPITAKSVLDIIKIQRDPKIIYIPFVVNMRIYKETVDRC